MTERRPAIVGLGFDVPAGVRTNDDPVFDWIKRHPPQHGLPASFAGVVDRRILADGESLSALMSGAARAALDQAGVGADEVDLLLGLGSVGEYASPNALAAVHRDLGLPSRCHVVPLATEFTVFNDALVMADAALRSPRGPRHALIVCGCDWSRHVSYHEATCIVAADGAGAAVMAMSDDASRFHVVDHIVETDTAYLGAMHLSGRPSGVAMPSAPFDPVLYTTPLMFFGEAAAKAFEDFGVARPPKLVAELLGRNGLAASDVCLVAHQASATLTDAWLTAIAPGQFVTTMRDFADMTLASVPVTLAARMDEIGTSHLVLLTVGLQQQASALLLARDRPDVRVASPTGRDGPGLPRGRPA